MDSDSALAARAHQRIGRIMMVLSIAGVMAAFSIYGPAAGAGFLAGAAMSVVNFRWLKQSVDSLGPGAGRKRGAVLFAIRYAVFGATAYVIVKYFEVSLQALLIGLLVSIAAVIIEIVYELIYARA